MDHLLQSMLPFPDLITDGFPRYENPPPKLDNLPEELILHIFRKVHDTPVPVFELRLAGWESDEWARYDQGTRGIQNIRLTCRKFNRISTELLVDFVGVDLSFESLARFRSIMGHPGIRKGVSMVRFRLPVYQRWLFADELDYMEECLKNPKRVARFLEPEVKELALQEALTVFRLAPKKVKAAIRHSHREYKQRYQAQDLALKQKQQFIQDVASVLKMSNNKALRVEFTDENDFPLQYRVPVQQATVENFLDLILRPPVSPTNWRWFGDGHVIRSTPAHMIPEMMAAFADERINIVDLDLRITKVTKADRKILGKMQLALGPIRAAMRNLQSFAYIHGHIEQASPKSQLEKSRPELSTLLHQCLPPSLQTLVLCHWVDIRPLRHHRQPALTHITLYEVRISVETLWHLLQWLEPRQAAITLEECCVWDGSSWADVLDLLRSRQQRDTCLISPRCWPFEVLGPELCPEIPIRRMVVCSESLRCAEEYIRGDRDTNPLR